jgi:hypothetical protein
MSEKHKIFEKLIEKYSTRLYDVLDELNEYSHIFQEHSKSINLVAPQDKFIENITTALNETKILGYTTFYLAQEAQALMMLLTLWIVPLEEAYRDKVILDGKERLKPIKQIIQEAEPFINQTLKDMDQYGTLDTKKVIEAIIKNTSF